MKRRRKGRWGASKVLRPALGLVLVPTALAVLLAAARVLGSLAAMAPAKGWGDTGLFLCGFAGYGVLYFFGLLHLRPLYVFSHELTHAIAVWLGGGKVFKFVVRADSGHVDLSRMNAFIALAPYWIPLYALALVGAYRLLLWAADPPYSRDVFLVLMGVSLSFHLMHTVRSLWVTHQSDLDHAGLILSISLIALLNGGLVLGALKCLFPGSVSLGESLRWVGSVTAGFWDGLAGLLRRGAAAVGGG